jgi:glutaredoxin-related protein
MDAQGSPDAPRCGFSAQVVQKLRAAGADFRHFDILQDPAIRDGLKVLRHLLTSCVMLTSQASTCACPDAARVLNVPRCAVQEHSDWPTYPQLYVNGEVSTANCLGAFTHARSKMLLNCSVAPLATSFWCCGVDTSCLDVYTAAWRVRYCAGDGRRRRA